MHDAKEPSDSVIGFSPPFYACPALRSPGPFCTVLKNRGNSRFVIFIGDGTGSNIGVSGCIAEQQNDSWHSLMLEETSAPSLPLD